MGAAIKDLPSVNVRLTGGAKLPAYATSGAACFDLTAIAVEFGKDGTATCSTGIQMEIPEGWALLVYSRSGMGFNANTRLVNCVGVIDSDYRGEILVKLVNDQPGYMPQVKDGDKLRNVQVGDKVAQARFVPVFALPFVTTDTLNGSDRGAAGFGSTGA